MSFKNLPGITTKIIDGGDWACWACGYWANPNEGRERNFLCGDGIIRKVWIHDSCINSFETIEEWEEWTEKRVEEIIANLPCQEW